MSRFENRLTRAMQDEYTQAGFWHDDTFHEIVQHEVWNFRFPLLSHLGIAI
jgi:hypothetical protein